MPPMLRRAANLNGVHLERLRWPIRHSSLPPLRFPRPETNGTPAMTRNCDVCGCRQCDDLRDDATSSCAAVCRETREAVELSGTGDEASWSGVVRTKRGRATLGEEVRVLCRGEVRVRAVERSRTRRTRRKRRRTKRRMMLVR